MSTHSSRHSTLVAAVSRRQAVAIFTPPLRLTTPIGKSLKNTFANIIAIATFSIYLSSPAFASQKSDGCENLKKMLIMFVQKRDEGIPKKDLIKLMYMMDGAGKLSDSETEYRVKMINQIYSPELAKVSPQQYGDYYYNLCMSQ